MQRIVIATVLAAAWVGSGYALLSGKVMPTPERQSVRETAAQTMVLQPVGLTQPVDDQIAKAIKAMEPTAPVPARPKTAIVLPQPAAALPANKRSVSAGR